jgi:hypothetical protein
MNFISALNSITCDFEENTCGYTADGSPYYNDWIRTNGTITNSNIIGKILKNVFFKKYVNF